MLIGLSLANLLLGGFALGVDDTELTLPVIVGVPGSIFFEV
jgi:hypothetical protein